MNASVVVVSYFTGPCLGPCLDALARAEGVDEIIVVDNGNDATGGQVIDAFAERDSRRKILRGQGNVGFAAACNLAARNARCDALVFVNPDVILNRNAVARLCAVLGEQQSPTIVGGDLRDEQGAPDRGSRRERLTLWRAIVSGSRLSRLERWLPLFRDFNRHCDPLPSTPTPTNAISGALLALRRVDFERIGGFDEGYFLHFEDIDLCRRAELAGWTVLFAPGPHGVHLRSSSKVRSRDLRRYKAQGAARYFVKHARGPVGRVLARLVGAFLLLVTR